MYCESILYRSVLFPVFLLFSSFRHDFHTSLAEVQYNQTDQTAEVSLRVFTDDLEAAIAKENNKTFRIDYPQADQLITAYVTKRFGLIDAKNGRQATAFVGKEITVDVTWIYLQIKATNGVKGLQLQNSIFMELFKDQVNIVNLKTGDSKRTYLFNPDEPIQEIGL